jgi:hypothetical protein
VLVPHLVTISRPAVELTQYPMQLVSYINRPEREAVRLPPSSGEVKNAWSYTSATPYVSMTWCSCAGTASPLSSSQILIRVRV